MRIERPIWAIEEPPACRRADGAVEGGSGRVLLHELDARDPIARLSCRQLGFPAGSILCGRDRLTDALHAVRIAGGVDDLFVTRRRTASDATLSLDESPTADEADA